MNRFYLIPTLLSFLSPLGSVAQVVESFDMNARPNLHNISSISNLQKAEANAAIDATAGNFTIVSGPMAKLPESDAEPLTMKSYLMNRAESLYWVTWGTYTATNYQSGRVGDIITGSDGSFYLKDIFMGKRIDTWLKGELKDGTVTFKLPQPVAYAQFEDGTSCKILAQVVELKELEDNQQTFVPAEGETEVTFSWDGETLRQLNPDTKIGMVLERDGTWAGYCDWDLTWTVQHDVPTKYNGGADAQPYGLSYFSYDFWGNNTLACETQLRFDGDDVYLFNLPSVPEGAVVKGSIKGDKATFPMQYLGIDRTNMCHVYFRPFFQSFKLNEYDYIVEDDVHPLDEYTMLFNADDRSFTADGENTYSINCGNGNRLSLDGRAVAHNAVIKPFDRNRAATPANPLIYMYQQNFSACFSYPQMDVDGNYIDPAQLYWCVYVNDEPFELDTAAYSGFDTDAAAVTEVPYSFTNNETIFSFNFDYFHQIVVKQEWEKMGIQMIYKAGGEVRKSDICFTDMTTKPAEVGLETLENDFEGAPVATRYYDISGREVNEPAHGLFIKVDTYSNGAVRSTKTTVR